MTTNDIANQAQDLKEQAQEWQDVASHQARKAARAAQDYFQENTWTGVVLAAAVGCIFGFLLARLNE